MIWTYHTEWWPKTTTTTTTTTTTPTKIDHSLPNDFRIRKPPNQSRGVNTNTHKRRWNHFCGAAGHRHHNCPKKKSKGDGDGADDKKKMIQFLIQFDRKMRDTPHHIMPKMRSLIVKNHNLRKSEVQENTSSQNDEGSPPRTNPAPRLTKNA